MTTTTAKMTATEKAEYGTLSTAQRRKYSLVKRANGWSHKDALEFAKRVA